VGRSCNAESVSGTALNEVRGAAGATCEIGVTKALAQRLSASAVATRSIVVDCLRSFYCYLSDCGAIRFATTASIDVL
jgi:hypothetical protein